MAENSHVRKMTAVQCHIRIKSNPIKVKVDFEYKELKINYKEKRAVAEISIEGIQKNVISQDYEELDVKIDKMLEEEEDSDEYEDKSDLDERESFHANWADEIEESGI